MPKPQATEVSAEVLEWGQFVLSLEKQLQARGRNSDQRTKKGSKTAGTAVETKTAALKAGMLELTELNCQLARRLQQLAVGLLQVRQELCRQEDPCVQQQQQQAPSSSNAELTMKAADKHGIDRELSLPRDSIDLHL